MPDTPTTAGEISQIRLPSGDLYNVKDNVSGYPTIWMADEGSEGRVYTMVITSTATNADEESY